MRINTAFILCAGFGKRLMPLTTETPKPLLKIKDICLLENTINFVLKLNIEKIYINTFYLSEKINEYIKKLNLKVDINLISDGPQILDTGGGILNLFKASNSEDALILNPDTIWNESYTQNLNSMEKYYFDKKIQNILLVVNKEKSFDKRFKGDFSLGQNLLWKEKENKHIFTGCQIISKNLFEKEKENKFSISKIWNNLIHKNQLHGFESKNDFYHLTDLEIYNSLNS